MAGRLIVVLITLVSVLLGFTLDFAKPRLFQLLDLKAQDVVMADRPVSSPDPRVVIVAIDEPSLQALGRWPWPRQTTAKLIEALAPASTTALDVVFAEPESPEADAALADAFAANGHVVAGFFGTTDPHYQGALELLDPFSVTNLNILNKPEIDPDQLFYKYDNAEPGLADLLDHADMAGSFNVVPDADGVIRRYQAVVSVHKVLLPTLATAALATARSSEVAVTLDRFGVTGVSVEPLDDENLPLPVNTDEYGQIALDYYGPAKTITTWSAVDVITGKITPEQIKGKIVFIGATATGIYDVRVTPIAPDYPGVEIHATACSQILQGRFLSAGAESFLLEALLILIAPMLVAFVIWRYKSTMAGIGGLIVGIALMVWATRWGIGVQGWQINPSYGFFTLLINYTAVQGYFTLVVDRRGRFLRQAFGSYVSPGLVDQLLRDPDALALGGARKPLTILFSDIRGFTTLSEKLSAEEMVSLLNRYLAPMTKIVMDEFGTLDKYIGDAVMAFWNAPLNVPDHPARGLTAALHMIEALHEFNADQRKRGEPEIDIGIGLHTGEAVVGNMGADIRFDYTIIGDAVNLTSRLEGLTKMYHAHILCTEDLVQALGDAEVPGVLLPVDKVKVKGKKVPVTIFTLVPDSFAAQQPLVEQTWKDYLERRFDQAAQGYETLAAQGLAFADPMACRARDYLTSPPPDDWDGAYTMTSK
ncbi:MAG: hypothetical protein COX57_08420 [Alphaproteobacteria bacterium CG_4_10_14_0_2_um_filter_63_37]|nr:MAG: hypothetical protein AUJ55_07515 [Proteobacteria bacterium CG1_02_64_396]PJA24474.1 MAG: hypothetical protein COX57_08420 [Alphaproteobacteria bacterium CG_4_10_14_0_2_um_filter_63_37]